MAGKPRRPCPRLVVGLSVIGPEAQKDRRPTTARSSLNLLNRLVFCFSWGRGGAMLTDAQWERLEPLIKARRPKGKTPPQDWVSGSACCSWPRSAVSNLG